MPSIADNQRAWDQYDWALDGDEWSSNWGGSDYLWHASVYPRIMRFLPAGTILELAPGHGRMTRYLKEHALQKLILVDLVERCIEACRTRYASHKGIEFHVNDGRSLPMVADQSVDFVFSFDSLVHVEADVMSSYVLELARILSSSGVAFIHHSNLAAFCDPETGSSLIGDCGARGRTMSARLLRNFCEEAGLLCTRQELINWGGMEMHDCFSVITRPGSPFADECRIRETPFFMNEAVSIRQVARLYYGEYAPQKTTLQHQEGR